MDASRPSVSREIPVSPAVLQLQLTAAAAAAAHYGIPRYCCNVLWMPCFNRYFKRCECVGCSSLNAVPFFPKASGKPQIDQIRQHQRDTSRKMCVAETNFKEETNSLLMTSSSIKTKAVLSFYLEVTVICHFNGN